ncbi:hypothetical protein [Maricaulis maris]|uniref:Uncharacterized protein n=1 Tax=Maricaulis maris TaxID=74318 RepID=A0A495D1R0_9PROT|nr:hypothetical protein [Maricaulis maris]RKQ95457.1 hypothetical protein C7435_2559 [Maricaulis maris]
MDVLTILIAILGLALAWGATHHGALLFAAFTHSKDPAFAKAPVVKSHLYLALGLAIAFAVGLIVGEVG